MTLTTLSDNGRHREPQSELIISSNLLADVLSCQYRAVSAVPYLSRGMVENVVVAAGMASPSVSVQQLFSFPVSTSGVVADT